MSNDKRSIEQKLSVYLSTLNNSIWSGFCFVTKEADLYAQKDVLFSRRLLQTASYLSRGDQNKKNAVASLNLKISLFLEDNSTMGSVNDPHIGRLAVGETMTAKNEQIKRGIN